MEGERVGEGGRERGEMCDKEQALFDREKHLLSLETSLVGGVGWSLR